MNSTALWRFNTAVTGEYAVSAWQDMPVDTFWGPDHKGTPSHDLEQTGEGDVPRIVVETTMNSKARTTIDRRRVDGGNLIVLCRVNKGLDHVEIIGYTSCLSVMRFGSLPHSLDFSLDPEYFHPTLDKRICAENARERGMDVVEMM